MGAVITSAPGRWMATGDIGHGVAAAERLRAVVEANAWGRITDELRVTVSIGVAAGTAPLRDLLRAADLAVYDAKSTGRNRVKVAPSGAEAERSAGT